MKKLLTIFFIICSFTAAAQYPAKQSLGSDSTLVTPKGALQGRLINWAYSDTSQANLEEIKRYPGAQIRVGDNIYHRSNDTTRWILDGSTGSALNNGLISIGGLTLVDSTLTVQHNIVWSINGVTYTRTTDTSFIIHSADSGYFRKDLIYANSSGVVLLTGTEHIGIAYPPVLPINSVVVTLIDIYGNQIANPYPVVAGKIPTWQQTMLSGDTTTQQAILNYNGGGYAVTVNSTHNGFTGFGSYNTNNGISAATGQVGFNDLGHIMQYYMGSSTNAYAPDQFLLRSTGKGGMKLVMDSGRMIFQRGLINTPYPPYEMGAFETDGSFRLDNYKNNASEDSVLSTDANGRVIMKLSTGTDSSAYHTIAVSSDSTKAWWSDLKGKSDTVTITANGYIPAGVLSVTGTSVNNTDPHNPVINNPSWGSITGTLSSQTDLQSALNAKQNTITLTTTGTSGAATLSGSTLNIPQYSGSSSGVDSVRKTLGTDSVKQYKSGTGTFAFRTNAFFNVKDYGASPSASASVNTASFDSCINAAALVSGTVYVPNGIYLVNTINYNPIVNIVGDGNKSSIIRSASAVPLLSYISNTFSEGSVVSDISLDCNNIGTIGLQLYDCADFAFYNVNFQNATYTNVSLEGALIGGFYNCGFSTGLNGVIATNNPSSSIGNLQSNLVKFDNCRWFGNTGRAIDWNNAAMISIDKCDLENNGVVGDTTTGAIRITGMSSSSEAVGLSISKSWFEGNYGTLLRINNSAGASRTTLTNVLMQFNPHATYGVYLNSGSYANSVSILNSTISGDSLYDAVSNGSLSSIQYLNSTLSKTLILSSGQIVKGIIADTLNLSAVTNVVGQLNVKGNTYSSIYTPSTLSAYPTNYINDASGASQLSIGSNMNPGAIDVSMINSNIAGGGFSWWKQTGVNSGINLMSLSGAGNLGLGIFPSTVKLHIVTTGEALRIGYDASHYTSYTPISTGGTTISQTGGGGLIYSPIVQFNNNVGFGHAGKWPLDALGGVMLGGYNVASSGTLTGLANSGQMFLGWNRSSGNGETDFISNGGGGSGGFSFYNYSNSAVWTHLMDVSYLGKVTFNQYTAGAFTGTPTNTLATDANGNVIQVSQAIVGTATLASGTVTVSLATVKTGARIYLTYNTPSGTQGFLSAPVASIVNNTSFVINSSSASDNSTVNYIVYNP